MADGAVGKNDPLHDPPENQWFSDFLFRCPLPSHYESAWHTGCASRYLSVSVRTCDAQSSAGAVHSPIWPASLATIPGADTSRVAKFDFGLPMKLQCVVNNQWALLAVVFQ